MIFSTSNQLLNLIRDSLNTRKVGPKRIYPNAVTSSNPYLLWACCPSGKTLENHSKKEWSMSSQILMNLAPPSVHSEDKHELYWILNVIESFLLIFIFHFTAKKKSCLEKVSCSFVSFEFSKLVRFARHLVPKDSKTNVAFSGFQAISSGKVMQALTQKVFTFPLGGLAVRKYISNEIKPNSESVLTASASSSEGSSHWTQQLCTHEVLASNGLYGQVPKQKPEQIKDNQKR